MPVYFECPHCDHPQIVPAHRRGRALFCRQCGRVIEADHDLVAPLEDKLQEQYGFAAVLNHFAISGLCADCQSKSQLSQEV